MRIIRSTNFLVLIAVLFIVGLTTSAGTLIGLPTLPTIVKYLAATKEPDQPTDFNPLFVSYPEILQEHRSKSKIWVENYSQKNKEYVVWLFNKGKKFFPRAEAILAQYDVPVELRMLPVLESEFNANAVSPVGAVGYWQFMSTLAREYGLKIGGKYDERKNFAKSTAAAARYFRDQLKYFDDDLLLAVASYNCGAGRVRASMKKSGKADANFWDIKRFLPLETRKFVMNFIALNVISENYDMFLADNLDLDQERLIPVTDFDSATYSSDVVDIKSIKSIKVKPTGLIKPEKAL